MCYLPNVRSRTCRFGAAKLTKKVVQECAFCHRTRAVFSSRWRDQQRNNPGITHRWRYETACPALAKPGRTVVEQDLTAERRWQIAPGIMVETAKDGRVVAVEVLAGA